MGDVPLFVQEQKTARTNQSGIRTIETTREVFTADGTVVDRETSRLVINMPAFNRIQEEKRQSRLRRQRSRRLYRLRKRGGW